MELFAAIDSRRSAARLEAPGPTAAQLERILSAAVQAPDHGRLRPWRFLVLDAAGRERFAAAAAAAKASAVGNWNDAQRAAERAKLLASPTLIIAACVPQRDNPRVPEVEQLLASGAAVQNLFLAAHALGFGVMWKTGAAAYDTAVKAAVGLAADDHVVGILHLGTRAR